MRVRRDVRTLTPQELRALREAFRLAMAQSTGRGYHVVSALHGSPESAFAPQHTSRFLPWYRLHLLDLERALRRHAPGVSLPYWNWSLPGASEEGLPAAFLDRTYRDGSGEKHANPLRAGWHQAEDRETRRDLGSPAALRRLGSGVGQARSRCDFHEEGSGLDLTSALERLHEGFCTWVGGDLASVASAAYDPLFYFHLANLDRLWAEWQARASLDAIPSELIPLEIAPYGTTLGSTLQHRHFDYTYDTLSDGACGSLTGCSSSEEQGESGGLLLRVSGLCVSEHTYEIRVFLDEPEADARTPTDGNPSFVDAIAVWGTGPDLRLMGYRPEFTRVVDLAPAVHRRAIRGGDLEVRLVVVDEDGQEVPLEVLGPAVSMGMANDAVPEREHARVS